MEIWQNLKALVRPVSRGIYSYSRGLLGIEKSDRGICQFGTLYKGDGSFSRGSRIHKSIRTKKEEFIFFSKCTISSIIKPNNIKDEIAFLRPSNIYSIDKKFINCQSDAGEMVGLLIGVYNSDNDPYGTTRVFTKFATEYDKGVGLKISEVLDSTGPIPKKGQVRIFYKLDQHFTIIAIVGLGDECASYIESEQMDVKKENVREAAASGVRALQDLKIKTIFLEGMGSTEAAAEGGALGVWRYQELKSSIKQKLIPRIELHGDCDYTAWQIGLQKAAAQNIARQLCETPANILTPLGFAQSAVEILCKVGISVEVRVREWAKINRMEGFLTAARGSCERPIFLETSYYGCEPDVPPIVLIGKGVTFNSGGICLKTCQAMEHMRGDMAGGAVIIGAMRAAAALQLPINIRGIIPIFENLPGSCAIKPGDTIKVRNGKTVLIHDTDYDGRLSLADALSYAQIYNPKFILDIGTFSNELLDSLGFPACGVFSNNDSLFETLKNSAIHTGDRVWRLPLWDHYSLKVKENPTADVEDRKIKSGMPCTCAAFLREFVPPVDWIHLDINSVKWSDGETELYLSKGMSGRPTRTIVEFLAQLACQVEDAEEEEAKKDQK